jgi:uncharacterized FlaG/YvyC family protein
MAVEDTDKIASIEPVVRQVHHARKEADSLKVSVSSPASSVEDGLVEKIKAEPNEKSIQSINDSMKLGQIKLTKEDLSKSHLEEITEGINQELSFFSNSIQFKIEEVDQSFEMPKLKSQGNDVSDQIQIKRKEIVVSVVDKRTGEVIRKIPPEDLLQSLYNASMFLGLIVDQVV